MAKSKINGKVEETEQIIEEVASVISDQSTVITEQINSELPEKYENEEVLFLKKILRIQNEGCFGTHLNAEILGRIEKIEAK